MLTNDSLVLYMGGTAIAIMISIIGYYVKETLSTIKVLGNGQDEIKESLVRIETDMVNVKENYSNLIKKTDSLTDTVHEHGIKIAKLE